jgi:hypothetical protein
MALASAHSSSKCSPGPRFYMNNDFQAIDIDKFLEEGANPDSAFKDLAINQKRLESLSYCQIYTWTPNRGN